MRKKWILLIVIILVSLFTSMPLICNCTEININDTDLSNILINTMREKNIKLFPPDFDPNNFSPKDYDPLFINEIWHDILGVIRTVLDSNNLNDLIVGPMFAYSLTKMEDWKPDKMLNGRYTIVVNASNELHDSLSRAIGIPKKCFVRIDSKPCVVTGGFDKFKKKYRCGDILCISEIAQDTSDLLNNKDKIFRKYDYMSEEPCIRKTGMDVSTSWKYERQEGDYQYFNRFYLEVEKQKDDLWNIEVRLEFGQKAIAEKMNKIRRNMKIELSEWEGNYNYTDNKFHEPYMTYRDTVIKDNPHKNEKLKGGTVYELRKISPLAALGTVAFDEFRKLLLEEKEIK